MTREDTTGHDRPWQTPWPVDGLESVTRCPVCGQNERDILHANLVDNTFRAAPGKWTLWQCAKCRSAYLDPHPSPDSIHLAYANYYTHQQGAGKGDYASLSLFRKLRRRLVNGYTNWRYSTKAHPASAFGAFLLFLLWPQKVKLGREYRNLPRRLAASGELLVSDVVNGAFLQIVRSCELEVTGVDPDPNAVGRNLA